MAEKYIPNPDTDFTIPPDGTGDADEAAYLRAVLGPENGSGGSASNGGPLRGGAENFRGIYTPAAFPEDVPSGGAAGAGNVPAGHAAAGRTNGPTEILDVSAKTADVPKGTGNVQTNAPDVSANTADGPADAAEPKKRRNILEKFRRPGKRETKQPVPPGPKQPVPPETNPSNPPEPSSRPKPKKPKLSAAERKKRRRYVRIAVAAVIALIAGILIWRHFHNNGGKLSTEVLTDEVQYGSIMSTVEGSGLTRAKNSETIIIPFAGTVKEVLVEEGDQVFAGDPLFVVDSDDARRAVEEAERGVDRANEAVDKANEAVQTARDRVRDAEAGIATAQDRVREAEAGVTSAQDRVREAEEGVTSARKRVETAEKALSEVRAKLDKLDIRAEYDGKLLETQRLNPGDTVSEGTAVAVLADDTRMRLTQYYSYAYAEDLREGQAVSVSIPRLMSEVSGTVEAVHMVARITDEGSRLFSADIVVENEGGLADGMEATATAEINGEAVYPYEAGKLEYYRRSEVKAEVTGKVISTILLDYLPVSEGQTLLVLDGEDLREKISDAEKAVEDAEKDVDSARERVSDAQKGVEDARKNVTDQQKGVEDARKNVTEQEKGVTDALKNVDEQKEAVAEAEKKLDEARENLEKCNGTAGIDGTVIGLSLIPGEEVTASQSAMAISDTSVIVVNATVDERNISYVKKGMTVDLNQFDMAFATGVIDSVSLSSSVNNGVATYPIVISADNYDGSIQVNSNINYSLVASQSDNCLLVPIQCVRTVTTEEGENKTVVYVQANFAPEGALENVSAGEEIPEGFWPVEVQTGIQDTYNVEIRSGLEAGTVVFTQIQSDQPW